MDVNSKVIPLHLHPLGFIEAFTHFDADLGQLLSNTNINENMLSSKDVKISYAQQHQLIKNGIRLCNKPGIGLLQSRIPFFINWCCWAYEILASLLLNIFSLMLVLLSSWPKSASK